VAVSVTDVPDGNFAVHEDGHEIPAGALATVPLPVTETLSCTSGVRCWGGGVVEVPPPQAERKIKSINAGRSRLMPDDMVRPIRFSGYILLARVEELVAKQSSRVAL
jgi:hypothetical protein